MYPIETYSVSYTSIPANNRNNNNNKKKKQINYIAITSNKVNTVILQLNVAYQNITLRYMAKRESNVDPILHSRFGSCRHTDGPGRYLTGILNSCRMLPVLTRSRNGLSPWFLDHLWSIGMKDVCRAAIFQYGLLRSAMSDSSLLLRYSIMLFCTSFADSSDADAMARYLLGC